MSVSAPSALLFESSLVMKKLILHVTSDRVGQGIFGNVEVDQQPYRIEAIAIQHCQLGQAPILKKGTTESKYKFLRYLPIIGHLKICAPL